MGVYIFYGVYCFWVMWEAGRCTSTYFPYKKWKKYYVVPGMVDGENGITWDTFTKTAHMHTILVQETQLLFSGLNAGIFRTLQRQISGEN